VTGPIETSGSVTPGNDWSRNPPSMSAKCGVPSKMLPSSSSSVSHCVSMIDLIFVWLYAFIQPRKRLFAIRSPSALPLVTFSRLRTFHAAPIHGCPSACTSP
jgi:hypothetical protein